uniref:Uncharacterized protein AlNc14C24G2441 n=1 Tax=Albugo laibachii Nc14 TaxID=890382 RepID=F0W6E1_9STRA|nr:conserved hypothetical protein [Albugo laibachii Nc14]|eukprot:CCA16685.1 conserved hypothetical protein [Albugo laibachii Nc14]
MQLQAEFRIQIGTSTLHRLEFSAVTGIAIMIPEAIAPPPETSSSKTRDVLNSEQPIPKMYRPMNNEYPTINTPVSAQVTRESAHGSKEGKEHNVSADLSTEQKQGCIQYIESRQSIANSFASRIIEPDTLVKKHIFSTNKLSRKARTFSARLEEHFYEGGGHNKSVNSNWELVKVRAGIEVYKSIRSRCEIRGVTYANASLENVMKLLAPGDSPKEFGNAQKILIGSKQYIDSNVITTCSDTQDHCHVGLKYLAIKNPFGMAPLDFVFLDYTTIKQSSHTGSRTAYRIVESIRVPDLRSSCDHVRASLRCEVYIVRETETEGLVQIIFASHLDPKTRYRSSKKSAWLNQVVVRLSNLRKFAEQASISSDFGAGHGIDTNHCTKQSKCSLCMSSFNFLRRRYHCQMCGTIICGRCSRRQSIFKESDCIRIRVCLSCIIRSRAKQVVPDKARHNQMPIFTPRRSREQNVTWIIKDE